MKHTNYKKIILENDVKFERGYMHFVEELSKHFVGMRKGSRVRLKDRRFAEQEYLIGTILEVFESSPEFLVRFDDSYEGEYRKNQIEPAELPEEQKKIFEKIREEVEEQHGFTKYKNTVEALIKESVPKMQEQLMGVNEIWNFFTQRLFDSFVQNFLESLGIKKVTYSSLDYSYIKNIDKYYSNTFKIDDYLKPKRKKKESLEDILNHYYKRF